MIYSKFPPLPKTSPDFYRSDDILSIEYGDPQINSGRVRKVIKRSGTRSTRGFSSCKLGRIVECESIIEHDQVCILDADLEVSSFQEQPCCIVFTRFGEVFRHYPDFKITVDKKIIFIENKCDEEAVEPDVVSRTQFMISRLQRLGMDYRLVTESAINQGFALKNARLLHRYSARHLTLSQELYALKALESIEPITLEKVFAIDPTQGLAQALCRLATLGDIIYPREKLLTFETVMRIAA